MWSYIIGAIVVLAVYYMGRRSGEKFVVRHFAKDEIKRGEAMAHNARRRINEQGDHNKFMDEAEAITLKETPVADLHHAQAAIRAFRANIPTAMLRVGWQEKCEGGDG